MQRLCLTAVATAVMCCASPLAWAQVAPAGGELLREAERPASKPPAELPVVPPVPAPEEDVKGPAVQVQGFVFSGAKLLSTEQLNASVQAWVGKRASLTSLRKAADAVAAAYREQGYLARAELPVQDIVAGQVRIVVVEGVLSGLRIERTEAERALPDETVRAYMLARQQVDAPVRPDDLQRAITLLNETPGTRAASALEPGEKAGQTRLLVSVQGAPLLTGSASLDNTGALATGETRATLNLALNSPLQRGEQFTFTGNTSAGSHYVRGGVSLPAGHDGWRVSAYGSYLDYGYDLNAVAYAGTARVLGGAATFPWRRLVTRNDTVQLSVERKQFNNQVGGVDLNDKHLDVFSLMLSGDRQDDWGGAGLWMYTAQLDAGRLDLSGNATDLAADQQAGAPNRQGAFQKLNLALTRMQRLSPQHSLNVAVSAQKALQNLDSAMKFQLSGPSGVRAYGVSEPSVDTGVLWRTDWRLKLSPTWTASVFHDQALGWRDASPNTATQNPNRLHLAGSGLGLSYESPDALQFNLSVAWRHGGNPARSAQTGLDADGTKRDMRVFATLAKSF